MSAGQFSDDIHTFTASAAVVHNRFVKQTTTAYDSPGSFQAEHCAAGNTPFGISVDSAASGGLVSVAYGDIGYLEVDGSGTSIAAGDYLKPTTAGVGVKATTSDVVGAIAMEPATAANVLIKVRIIPAMALTSPPSTIARTDIVADVLPVSIPLDAFVTWDATKTALPAGAGTNDDLGWVVGVLGTSAPYLRSKDFKATTCTQYALAYVPVPKEYVAGQALTLRVTAGAMTTISDGTLTVDANVYDITYDATSDICSTAATTCNTLIATPTTVNFTITPTHVSAGDMLAVRVAIIGGDTATGTAVIGVITGVSLRPTVEG